MNERYHRCVSVCKHIQQRLGITMQNALTPQVVIATADKLIYNYAIEMVCHDTSLKNFFPCLVLYIHWIKIINIYKWTYTYENTLLIDWDFQYFFSQCQTAALDELFGNPQEVI